jgi:hypothetical protein
MGNNDKKTRLNWFDKTINKYQLYQYKHQFNGLSDLEI